MWAPLRRRAVSVTDSSMRQLGPLDLVLCPNRGVPVTDDMRCEGVEVVVSATTQVADLCPSTPIDRTRRPIPAGRRVSGSRAGNGVLQSSTPPFSRTTVQNRVPEATRFFPLLETSGEQSGLTNLASFTRILEADGHRTRSPLRHRSRHPSPETGDPNE
jgi:hypothetical protein